MEIIVNYSDFGIYNVDVKYLKYMHDKVDSQVVYAPNYERKPFIGIVIGIGSYTYFIPLTSAKQKHLNMDEVGTDYFLIYEDVDKNRISPKWICRDIDGNEKMMRHILASLNVFKMIPVPKGLYKKIEFDKIIDIKYRDLLEKEYAFCHSIRSEISGCVTEIYEEQISDKVVNPWCCHFLRLEKASDTYLARHGNKPNQT